jgi:hypothetical protein
MFFPRLRRNNMKEVADATETRHVFRQLVSVIGGGL